MIVFGVLVVIGLAGHQPTLGPVKSIGAGLFLAGSSLFVGGFLGFLFGIPQAQNNDRTSTSEDSLRHYTENTNLEQISDWLTKIIVGLTLVQYEAVRDILFAAGKAFGPFLVTGVAGENLATGTIIYFILAGFLFAYLWTRINLEHIFRSTSAMWNRDISAIVESRVQTVIERDLELIETVENYLAPMTNAKDPAFGDLSTRIEKAAYGTRADIYQMARRARIDNKKALSDDEKAIVAKTVVVFRGLVAAAPDEFPENYSQLGRAIIYSETPNWQEARDFFLKALELKGDKAQEDSSTHLYLALTLIKLDQEFGDGLPSKSESASGIRRSLDIAARGRTLSKQEDIREWAARNAYQLAKR